MPALGTGGAELVPVTDDITETVDDNVGRPRARFESISGSE